MTKAANILTLISLIIIPLGITGPNVHQAHVNTLLLVCFVGLALYLKNKWLTMFMLYVSAWWAFVYFMIWIGRIHPQMSLIVIDAILFFVFGAIFYLAVYHSPFKLDTWFNIICIAVLIQCVIGILQQFGFDLPELLLKPFVKVNKEGGGNVTGTLGNRNFFSTFLAISFPFFIRKKWIWFIPVIVAGLIIGKTSSAGIAVIIGMAYFIGGWRLAVLILFPLIAYLLIFDYSHIFQNERIEMWRDGIKKITSSWNYIIFGTGPGIQWKIDNQLHNEYLMTVWNYGLIGLSFFIGFIVTSYKSNRILFSAFLILCIDMIGSHALHTTPTALLAIIIIALMQREKEQHKGG